MSLSLHLELWEKNTDGALDTLMADIGTDDELPELEEPVDTNEHIVDDYDEILDEELEM